VASIERPGNVKAAVLIVIGDEILTGKVKDDNSFVFTRTMFERGVRVSRIETIPDNIDVIAKTVAHHANSTDYVCTSGGVGPTHDDVTFDGIAKAFALPIKEHDEAFAYFHSAQQKAGRGDLVSEAQRKMLRYPTPCQVYFVQPLWLPLVVVNNVYIFPGVPYLFEKLLLNLAHLFVGGKFFRETVYTNLSENQIAANLKAVQDENRAVAIGSYPKMPGGAYSVMITVEGVDENKVHAVAQKLMPLIDGRRAPS